MRGKAIKLGAPGAHNPERATSRSSSQGAFTNLFIFRTILVLIWSINKVPQQSAKPKDLKMAFLTL